VARRYLGRSCENCGATTQLQAHHRDRNWLNNARANVATLCKECHAEHHAAERRATSTETVELRGKSITVVTTGRWFTTTPLPLKTDKEIAHAAAWGALKLLEETVAEACGKPPPRAFLWSRLKRRFSIAIGDNRRIEGAWRRACAELDLLSVYPYWYLLPADSRPMNQGATEWYAEHRSRVPELLAKARTRFEATRPTSLPRARERRGKTGD
jgi:hypothetical protein